MSVIWEIIMMGELRMVVISAGSLLGRLLFASSPRGCMARLGKEHFSKLPQKIFSFWRLKTFNIYFTSQPLASICQFYSLISPSCSSAGAHRDKWSRRTSLEKGTFQALNHFTEELGLLQIRAQLGFEVWAYLVYLVDLVDLVALVC